MVEHDGEHRGRKRGLLCCSWRTSVCLLLACQEPAFLGALDSFCFSYSLCMLSGYGVVIDFGSGLLGGDGKNVFVYIFSSRRNDYWV